MSEWPFDDPPNLAVITVRQILRQGFPVLLVSHDSDDGGWQFLTGGPFVESDAMVVSLRTMIRHDPSLMALADLPVGWQARRTSRDADWERISVEDSQQEDG